jgi:carbon storage regulator
MALGVETSPEGLLARNSLQQYHLRRRQFTDAATDVDPDGVESGSRARTFAEKRESGGICRAAFGLRHVGSNRGGFLSVHLAQEPSMLVLSRKIGETIQIGTEMELVVLEVTRGRVKLGFVGSRDVPVRRGELVDSPRLSETVSVPADQEQPVCASLIGARKFTAAPLRAFRATVAGG